MAELPARVFLEIIPQLGMQQCEFNRGLQVNVGAVHTYYRAEDDSIHYINKLTGSDSTAGARFGYAISMDGDTLAVGTPAYTRGEVE